MIRPYVLALLLILISSYAQAGTGFRQLTLDST